MTSFLRIRKYLKLGGRSNLKKSRLNLIMNYLDLINRDKLKCDNIMSITLLASFLVLFLFYRFILYMSLMVYPLCSAFIFGLYYIYRSLFKEKKTKIKILRFIQGAIYIVFSTFMLLLIFSYPHITLNYIVYFLAIPVIFIGAAAILKGSIVDVYSPTYRKFNIFIGVISIIITILDLYILDYYFIISLTSLIILLILNGISRSALYLSEYGLSLRNLKNMKYVFLIMDNLIVVDLQEENEEKI